MKSEELYSYCLITGGGFSAVVVGVLLMKLLPLAALDLMAYEDVAIVSLIVWVAVFALSTHWLFRKAVRFVRLIEERRERGGVVKRGGTRKVEFFARGVKKHIRIRKKRYNQVG